MVYNIQMSHIPFLGFSLVFLIIVFSKQKHKHMKKLKHLTHKISDMKS